MFALSFLVPTGLAQVAGGDVPEINVQAFRPSVDGEQTLWADDAARGVHGNFDVRALFHYMDDPLVYTYEDGETLGLVRNVIQANLLPSYALGPIRLGADVPVYLFQTGDNSTDGAGLGDVAVDGKVSLLDSRHNAQHPFGLALNGRVSFPTATVEGALGARNTGWQVSGIVDKPIGRFLVTTNVGVLGGPRATLENVELDDFLDWRVATAYGFTDRVGAAVELAGRNSLGSLTDVAGAPMELMVSGYGRSPSGLVLRGGAGFGLTEGIGAPDFRIVLGGGWERRPQPVEAVVEAAPDPCAAPQTLALIEGCPDRDADGDGWVDGVDRCPLLAEDVDGDRDDDGCPDAEIPVKIDLVDALTGEPIADGTLTLTGADDYRDGGQQAASLSAMLLPGSYEVTATSLNHLTARQTFSVESSSVHLTLALSRTPLLQVVEGKIELEERIYFDTNKATIKRISYDILDAVAAFMRDHAEVTQLRIEGHTDSRGSDAFNLTLSQARAASVVQYLVDQGVEAERLSSEGFGESRPRDTSEGPEAWEMNRRVDIYIEELAQP